MTKFFDKLTHIEALFINFLLGALSFIFLNLPLLELNASNLIQVPNQIIVKYREPSFSPLNKEVEQNSQDIARDSLPFYKYTAVIPGQIDLVLIEGEDIMDLVLELQNDPNVEYIEPHYIKQFYGITTQRKDLPNDENFSKQWALKNFSSDSNNEINYLDARALCRKNISNNPVIIGIIDSTFAINHPDLVDQLWVNKEEIPGNGIDDDGNGYIDDIHGFDFENLSPNTRGNDDHGTHVAGICAAESNNGIGISGVFPDVKFIALACSGGEDTISTVAILRAKEYLVELKKRGYNIISVNASYGGNYYSQSEYESIKNLSDLGILFCAAAGNDGWNLDIETNPLNSDIPNSDEDLNGNGILEVSYPSSYNLPNIISVASINSDLQLVHDSNYGVEEVDIAAPGELIYSTVRGEQIREMQDITVSNGISILNQWIENSANISENALTASIIPCGIGEVGDFPNEVNGAIALIQRGTLFFSEKVANAMNAGAIATIIYNNIEEYSDGLRNWTLGGITNTPWIPSFSISKSDGEYLLQRLPLTVTLKPFIDTIDPNSIQYAYLSGTSMAAPFVTAAAAFAAFNFPNETMVQRRNRIINNTTSLPSLSNKIASEGIVNLRKIVDTDEDKLPDWWEMDHFNTLAYTNSQDVDNDNYSNRDEFLSKKDPTNPDDQPVFKTDLKVSNLTFPDSNTLSFEFMTHPGYTYKIQNIDSLSMNNWVNNNQSILTGDGIPIKVTIDDLTSNTKRKQYYRVQATAE